ncbi:uncharacterized protein VTP21DRAFT_7129 [Calcarisporiella thermophila]|uniref:uncharacterized protein n=1 Tax=Calcarisporiella thermophila TaxID=911321 RepID=UPI003741FAD3
MSTQQQPQHQQQIVNNLKTKYDYYYRQLDKELSKSPFFCDLEKTTNIDKVHMVSGAALLSFILIFFNIFGQLITNLIGVIYPVYKSFKALETRETNDDTQWLTYWTVYGFFSLLEHFTDLLLFWIPFYFLFKTAFLLWLILPQFRGAEVLYSRFLRSFLIENEREVDSHISKLQQTVKDALAEEKESK